MKKIITTSLVLASALMADPFVAYPGTKAKGMGGAFTAVANNNSAMYFNPAGMTNFESDENYGMFTLEIGKAAGFDGEAEEFSDSTSYFVSLGTSGNGFNGGIALYNLYSVRGVATDDNMDAIGGTIANSYRDQDISVLSGSLSYELAKEIYPMGGKLSIGATLGVGFSGGGLFNWSTTEDDGTTSSSADDDTLDARGTLMAVGIKARLFNSMTFKVDVGANYRAQTKMHSIDDETYTYEQVDAMDIPQEIAFGAAAMYFTEYGVFTLALDQKTTGYEEATKSENSKLFFLVSDNHVYTMPDYKTTAVGLDYSGPLLNLRGGIYKSTPDSDFIEVTGTTAGVGFEWDNGLMLELSVDKKSYTYSGYDIDDKMLYSASMNWTF